MSSIFLPIIDNGAGNVKANFLICCANAFRERDVHMERYSDSLTPRARNRAAASFLRGKWQYMLFIDTDIVFSKEQIDMLMESDADIVAGIYCKKENEVAPCLNWLESNTVPAGGYVEIARAGTGFLRFSRAALERAKETPAGKCSTCGAIHWTQAAYYKNHGGDEWDFFSVGVKDQEYLSEDWFASDRARALGFKVMLDTRIQTKHEGTTFYPTDEAIQRQVEREKQMLANSNLSGSDGTHVSAPSTVQPMAKGETLSAQNLIDPLGLVTPPNN